MVVNKTKQVDFSVPHTTDKFLQIPFPQPKCNLWGGVRECCLRLNLKHGRRWSVHPLSKGKSSQKRDYKSKFLDIFNGLTLHASCLALVSFLLWGRYIPICARILGWRLRQPLDTGYLFRKFWTEGLWRFGSFNTKYKGNFESKQTLSWQNFHLNCRYWNLLFIHLTYHLWYITHI